MKCGWLDRRRKERGAAERAENGAERLVLLAERIRLLARLGGGRLALRSGMPDLVRERDLLREEQRSDDK
ncbi:MAG TPA: hypothetical protein VF262_03225 [Burkholderiales bacterium]